VYACLRCLPGLGEKRWDCVQVCSACASRRRDRVLLVPSKEKNSSRMAETEVERGYFSLLPPKVVWISSRKPFFPPATASPFLGGC